jgi:hypothetical protein
LYDLLKPHVTELIVCDPRKNFWFALKTYLKGAPFYNASQYRKRSTRMLKHPLGYSQMTGNLKLCEGWMLRSRRAAKFPRSLLLVHHGIWELLLRHMSPKPVLANVTDKCCSERKVRFKIGYQMA